MDGCKCFCWNRGGVYDIVSSEPEPFSLPSAIPEWPKGAAELCGYIDSKQMRRGLITRNVKASVDLFHQRFGLKFVPALSREFRPYKPNPAPLLHICSSWGIPPDEVMMIGDSLRDDVTCGKRAGAFTCLLDESGRYGPLDSLSDDLQPNFKVSSLAEVQSLLDINFELLPHPQTT